MAPLDLPANDPGLLAHRQRLQEAVGELQAWRRRVLWPLAAATILGSVVAAAALYFTGVVDLFLAVVIVLLGLAAPFYVNIMKTRALLRVEVPFDVEAALTKALREWQARNAKAIGPLQNAQRATNLGRGAAAALGLLAVRANSTTFAALSFFAAGLAFLVGAYLQTRRDTLEAGMVKEGISQLTEAQIRSLSEPERVLGLVAAMVLAGIGALVFLAA
ncbi:MAG TPA: hypothetical protein VNZ52_04840 [Candidatus Thermoplasmatota archaeon]|nr:hypothetical protein [Candidatus Thermoplasmatota archaeon]